jgi:AraC-like DNA-binding protein
MIMSMRSEDLPPADRFPWWCEQIAKDTVPTVASSPHAADFRASVTRAEMGPVDLYVMTCPEAHAVRTSALVRRSDPERYGLCVITANAVSMAQRDRECRVEAGDLLLYDTSQPFRSRTFAGQGRDAGLGGMVILQLPKAALPLRSQQLDGVLARRLPAASGMNAILTEFLTGVANAVEHAEVGEREAEQLGGVALDLAVAALAASIDAEDQVSPETRRQALLARIEAFIEHNLGDPELTPAAIAARHHISLSYLHRLFQPRDLTVAAWIRCLRLERARADLADPRLRSQSVQAIAARWGFRHAADFSRAFRAAHGMPPGGYRHLALGSH